MIVTAFTRLTGATVPIQAAAMPGIATPALVAAVAEAGAVGMLPAPLFSAAELEATLARLVEFFYGEPAPELVAAVHAGGALASWQVGSIAEALAAEAAGCDVVVVQGTEAGGHVRGTTSLLPLLSGVLDRVRVPVLAAGGIATARDLAAVLACGAAGARVGTRLVATTESGAHPAYIARLLAATAGDTVLTTAFSGLWPDAPHRVLRSAVDAAAALPDGIIGEAAVGDRMEPVPRFSVMAPTAGSTGHIEAMALYAGESVANVTTVQAAAAVIGELVTGAEQLLSADDAADVPPRERP